MDNTNKLLKLRRKIYYTLRKIQVSIPNIIYKKKEHHYLFILCPPFCGSTLLTEIISTSDYVSCNNNIGTREGQTLPELNNIMFNNRWDKKKKLPWKEIKNIWEKYWNLSKPVLLEKSTTNIMRLKHIKEYFNPVSFICMVRNPYAQCESIIRRNKKSIEYAALFTLDCLRYQKYNIETGNRILFISYDDLCDKTTIITNKITSFIPEIGNVNTNRKFKSHNFKKKGGMTIKNLNKEKISFLEKKDIKEINKYFIKEEGLLNFFNYPIINN